jgi:small subunit ribosomal protein S20
MAKLKTGRHTSALKAARQSLKRRWANLSAKTQAKDLAKELLAAVAAKDVTKAKATLPKVMSAWQRLGTKNVVHHTAASRKIARLSKAIHKLATPK